MVPETVICFRLLVTNAQLLPRVSIDDSDLPVLGYPDARLEPHVLGLIAVQVGTRHQPLRSSSMSVERGRSVRAWHGT